MGDPQAKVGTWQSLREVAASWRLLSITLISFSSGLPLGLVWLAVPAWMTQVGVNIKVVGLFTLAQAPWTFKVLWSPFMDRYAPPFLGRKRGWVLVTQVALFLLGLWLAAVGGNAAEHVGLIALICFLTAFASASQDIAYDAYAVEVLRKEEHGVAVGARSAVYQVAKWVSGRLSITAAAWTSWPVVNVALAFLYLPLSLVTRFAPEPEALPPPPRTLREAVWEPFVGLLAKHRALEILAFVVLYKLSDNLTQALTGPFLIQTGFSPFDVGVASGTIGLFAMILGTFLGGILAQAMGLGPALWISGLLQIFSNVGYAVVAQVGVNRPVMYSAQAFEYVTTGMGSGALGVLLLRLTQRRFSATQYALLTSLFAIPRVLAGPIAGVLADTIGWRDFFLLTLFAGVPGLVMLYRFVPWGTKEPQFDVAAAVVREPLDRQAITGRAVAVGAASFLVALAGNAVLDALRSRRAGKGFDPLAQFGLIWHPATLGGWTTLLGSALLAILAGLATAAALVARRSAVSSPGE